MEVKEEIISVISSDTKISPFNFIFNEIQKPSLFGSEINPNVRRIVKEWANFFQENKDETNLNKIKIVQQILCNATLKHFMDGDKIDIPNKKVKSIYEEYGSQVIKTIIENIKNKVLDFPYKKYNISDEHLNQLIDNVRSFNSSEIISNESFILNLVFSKETLDLFPQPFMLVDEYKYFKHSKDEYDNIDVITDYFTETERMKSVRADQIPTGMSPLDIWTSGNSLTQDIVLSSLNAVLSSESTNFDMTVLRNEIFNSSNKPDGIKESTQFKVSLAMSVIKYFCPTPESSSMLDISAGWGDRLISAIGCNLANYFACDPNKNLKSGHDKIKDTLLSSDKKHLFNIAYEPFESATLPAHNFDLVFSSPPFFDLEKYDDDAEQSLVKYGDGTNWLVNFLFVSLKKAWEKLNIGGHMVIHITDTPTLKICEPMVLFCQYKLKKCNYLGVLGSMGNAGIVRPMWVFQKSSSSSSGMARDAEMSLSKNFSNVHKLVKKIK